MPEKEDTVLVIGAGSGILPSHLSKKFLDPAEGGGIKNYVPELGAFGRPSSLVPSLWGLSTLGLGILGSINKGPTARKDLWNDFFLTHGGASLFTGVFNGILPIEEQAATAGLVLGSQAQLSARTRTSSPSPVEQSSTQTSSEEAHEESGHATTSH